MSGNNKVIKVEHLHNAISRDIGGNIGWFNIIIDMNKHQLSDLYVLELAHVAYPDYMSLMGHMIIGKRGVLIENIEENDCLNGRLTLMDIDNKPLMYPFRYC